MRNVGGEILWETWRTHCEGEGGGEKEGIGQMSRVEG